MNSGVGQAGGGIKSASDTQSASHALAQAVVVWNVSYASDHFAVCVVILVKTATREGKERRCRTPLT